MINSLTVPDEIEKPLSVHEFLLRWGCPTPILSTNDLQDTEKSRYFVSTLQYALKANQNRARGDMKEMEPALRKEVRSVLSEYHSILYAIQRSRDSHRSTTHRYTTGRLDPDIDEALTYLNNVAAYHKSILDYVDPREKGKS